jgi:hypothetical protein
MVSSGSFCPFVLVDQTTENWSTRDAFVAQVRDGVGGLWWAKVTAAVGPSTVVVPNIFREHDTQVPLIADQHAVGEFGSDRTHEPFGETVRPRRTWKNPDHADAHIGQDRIERCGELAGPISDQETELGEVIAKIHHQLADLWVVHRPYGFGVTPSRCTDRLATSQTKNT